jgi:DNA-binding response OmpR family regulator
VSIVPTWLSILNALASDVRGRAAGGPVPFVVTAQHGETKEKALHLDADGYRGKPGQARSVPARVRAVPKRVSP